MALIIAGIATGCRSGELLGLQWRDVKVTTGLDGKQQRSLLFSAATTKSSKSREVPVTASSNLAAVLDMGRHAPNGKELSLSAYVFGNAAGERIGKIQKAWQVAVLKAHGHEPQWVKGKRNHLTPESRAAYHAINLHFHDLRASLAADAMRRACRSHRTETYSDTPASARPIPTCGQGSARPGQQSSRRSNTNETGNRPALAPESSNR